MTPDTTRQHGNTCPHCGALCDASTPAGHGEALSEGDVTLCLYCRDINLYGPDLRLVAPTRAQRKEIMDSPAGEQIRYLQIMAAGADVKPH